MRTRIALATTVIVALEITTAMSITAGGALVLSGAISDRAHDSTSPSTSGRTSVGSAVASLRALGAETVARRTPVTAGVVGTPVPPTAGGTSSVPRSSGGTDGHVGNDQAPPTSLPRNATTSTPTIPSSTSSTSSTSATSSTTGAGQTLAATTGTTGTTAEAVATGASNSDASSTETADWSCIRNAESGDVYNSASEPQGAYGILDSTWQSLGYSGSPYEASASEQDAAALQLYRQYGWQPWGTRYSCGLG
jgi:Transglycosylase-like domain